MIAVLGAGAFGAALAIVLAQDGHDVVLWARDPDAVAAMRSSRIAPRLPGAVLPDAVIVTADLHDTVAAEALLLAVPAQALGGLLATLPPTQAAPVACCKGIDLVTGNGPSGTIAAHLSVPPLVLTGPSFAAEVGRGLPAAVTLAAHDGDFARHWVGVLHQPRTEVDAVVGAHLGEEGHQDEGVEPELAGERGGGGRDVRRQVSQDREPMGERVRGLVGVDVHDPRTSRWAAEGDRRRSTILTEVMEVRVACSHASIRPAGAVYGVLHIPLRTGLSCHFMTDESNL